MEALAEDVASQPARSRRANLSALTFFPAPSGTLANGPLFERKTETRGKEKKCSSRSSLQVVYIYALYWSVATVTSVGYGHGSKLGRSNGGRSSNFSESFRGSIVLQQRDVSDMALWLPHALDSTCSGVERTSS